MTFRERIYISSFVVVALLAVIFTDSITLPVGEQFARLFILMVMAVVSQFFEVRFHDGRSYYPHSVFFFAGVILLPPYLFIPLFTVPLGIAMMRTIRQEGHATNSWRDLVLNVAVHVLIGSSAQWLYLALNNHLNEMVDIGQGFAALVAAFVYVMGNHTLFRMADVFINKTTWHASGVWLADNLWAEFVMVYLGYVVAILWFVNAVMILPMLGVLVLIQKALMLPKLRHEAQTDSKTGLLNIRYFNRLANEVLGQAQQTGRTFSVIMADLDFLRRINNNYGHLAGDMVLVGISRIIQRSVRHEDAVGRFGGEEFAVLLPDIDQEEACAVAERIRVAIEESCFDVPTNQAPIKITMSLGIASYPQDAQTVTDLIHQADLAVYQAKKEGRNRIVTATDLFYRLKEDESEALSAQDAHVHPSSSESIAKHPRVQDEAAIEFHGRVLPAPLIHLLSPRVAKVVIPLLAALMVWWGTLSQQPVAWNAVIGLMFLAGVTQYLCVSLFSVDRLSVAAAILFTSALLTGLPGVALVSAAIVLASILAQTKLPWRHRFSSAVLYQWGTDVIACSAPALLITILALPLHVSYALLFGAPFVLVALFYSYTTAALTALDQTLMTGKSFVHLWREEYQELPWHYLLLALIGLCFAIVYTMFGWKGMVLSALPIYIMYFSQEHLAGQTKQWWGHYVVSKKQWS